MFLQSSIDKARRGNYLDLGFIIDSSASFKDYYNVEKDFIKSIASRFDLDPYKTRTSVMSYSNYINMISKFSDFQGVPELKKAIDSAAFMGSNSRVDKALAEANDNMFSVKNGGRAGVKQILVIVTDGVSSASGIDPFAIAKKIKNQNIHVVVVAVGNSIQPNSLDALGNQVFYLTDYSDLGSLDFSAKVLDAVATEGKYFISFLLKITGLIMLSS